MLEAIFWANSEASLSILEFVSALDLDEDDVDEPADPFLWFALFRVEVISRIG